MVFETTEDFAPGIALLDPALIIVRAQNARRDSPAQGGEPRFTAQPFRIAERPAARRRARGADAVLNAQSPSVP